MCQRRCPSASPATSFALSDPMRRRAAFVRGLGHANTHRYKHNTDTRRHRVPLCIMFSDHYKAKLLCCALSSCASNVFLLKPPMPFFLTAVSRRYSCCITIGRFSSPCWRRLFTTRSSIGQRTWKELQNRRCGGCGRRGDGVYQEVVVVRGEEQMREASPPLLQARRSPTSLSFSLLLCPCFPLVFPQALERSISHNLLAARITELRTQLRDTCGRFAAAAIRFQPVFERTATSFSALHSAVENVARKPSLQCLCCVHCMREGSE